MPHVIFIGGVSHTNTSFLHIMRRVGGHLNTGTIPVRLGVNTRRSFENIVSLVGVGAVG